MRSTSRITSCAGRRIFAEVEAAQDVGFIP